MRTDCALNVKVSQPYPLNTDWAPGNPMTGTKSAGIAFYQTLFRLDITKIYDVPLSFYFGDYDDEWRDGELPSTAPLWTSYQAPAMVPMPSYTKRAGAY
jgi:hypothetical protein